MDVDLRPVADTDESSSFMEDCVVRDPETAVSRNRGLPTKRRYDPLPDAGGSREAAAEKVVRPKRTKHFNEINRVKATKASSANRNKCKTSARLQNHKERQKVKASEMSGRVGLVTRTKQKTATKPETLLRKRRLKTSGLPMKIRPVKGTKRKAGTKTETLVKKQRFETTKVSMKIVQANASKKKAIPRSQILMSKRPGKTKSQTLIRKHRCKTKPETFMRKHKGKAKPQILTRKPKSTAKMETASQNRGAKIQMDSQMCSRGSNRNLEILARRQRGQTKSMKTVPAAKRRVDTKPRMLKNEQSVRATKRPVKVLTFHGTKQKTRTKPETLTRSQWLKATQTSMVQHAEKRLLTTTSHASLDLKYQQLEKIGEGGFGSVYAGYRKTDSFPVAIKHIPKDEVKIIPLNIKGRKRDVPLEALLMLQASCIKNADGKSAVVSLLDKYDFDRELVLVMEKPARSVDLFTYITRCRLGHLKENEAKNIIRQLVDAAIKMHAVNVFHRDLKPGNILLEATYGVPRVRVIDFGCSCFVTEEPYHDYTGTLSYAPPEFVLRGSYKAGPTTVWHLGAMLFELLAGRKQFDTLLFISKMLQLNRIAEISCRCA
ncbi:uncharacterized protein LOC133514237 isoform X2 [Syngnathoides biaculeatus]|uniref:uncharacterized protein LOC133514237 isoform X2 n=1 Tax=Syngnathoides biaculeatus TaxID=300417 RepID=UPI002ADD91E5|nr:uncharacterized protein LOC133514237 isoform X2 [Syngnathoides biaculeatus]